MAKLSKLPLALYPHHDGSPLYVSTQQPKLLEDVKIKVRVHESIGDIKEVRVRSSENGEPYNPPVAKRTKATNGWLWFETSLHMYNPQMHYRFSIELKSGELYWLNAHGLFETDQPDIHDFRINTFSSAPEWGAGTIMYQIFPDRFARSEKADKHKLPSWAIKAKWSDEVIGSGKGTSEQFFGGDLWGVIEHLDHLKKLGVTMLYLTPIFPGRSNHRYDASTFDEVDPLLGGNEALVALIKAAHAKGFKIIGDLTSNHSGDAHEWFKAAYKNPKAAESDFYYFSEGNKKYESWLGVPSLPKFNWKSKELRKRFIEGKTSVVAKWLKAPYGFDGWRIDVANMTGRIRDEDMYLEVSKVIRKTMVDINPNTIMLGEYTSDAAYHVQGNGWQGAMSYANFTKPLWRWLWNPKETRQAGFMGNTSRRENGKQFVQSHTQFAAGYPWHVRLNNMNPLDTHDIPRFKTFTIAGAQKVGAAAQFTFPGIPVIWMGDEFGLDGWNGENSRTPMPWNNERKHDKSMVETYAHLASLRKTHEALTHGSLRWLYASDEAVVYIRETKKESVLIALSRGKDDQIEFPTDALAGNTNALELFGTANLQVGKKTTKVSMGKVSVGIWSLSSRA
ncbi:MAG: glycoside hydrolase family 13 protein [Micrococcales bacterium]